MVRISIFSCLALVTGLLLLARLVIGHEDEMMAGPAARKVAAQGRLEPDGGVIKVTAPYAFSAPQVLTQLLVKTGDSITKGQPIATLDSHERLQAAVTTAQMLAKLAVDKRSLAETHFRAGEIEAAEASAARVQAELDFAVRELERRTGLKQTAAVSETDQEMWKAEVASKSKLLEEMKLTHDSLRQVLAAELKAATTAVEVAKAEVRRAEVELAYGSVRAPQDGQVLKTLVRSGELAVGTILELGDTRTMFVVAEVYETDIRFVKLDAKAVITSPSLAEPLWGKVASIGLRVDKRDAFNVDPAARTDGRVIEVKIRLDDSEPAAGLSHLEVEVVIDADS